jgi:hypothetical protein
MLAQATAEKLNVRDVEKVAQVLPVTLSDGSKAFNVVARIPGSLFIFAMIDEQEAENLVHAMNLAVWIDKV